MILTRHLFVAAMALLPIAASAQQSPVVIRHATIHPIVGEEIADGAIVLKDGSISEVGENSGISSPPGAKEIDATGKHVLPGLIDTHSHMGVYSWPGVEANSDGNEMVAPITAQVRAEDAINLEDPAYELARAGGITSMLVIPGSGNMIGGEGVVLKLRPDALLSTMKMAEAPRQIKMAMGENPKRVYGERGEMPSTRMGIMAKHREVWTKAKEYQVKLDSFQEKTDKYNRDLEKWNKDHEGDEPEKPDPVEFDPMLDVLCDVMRGEVRVQIHCYRKDDMLDIIRISDEFGFKITAFHHALEGYKLADELAKRGIAACTWPDWWGFKMEAYDAVPQNMAIMANAGVLVALHSDSANMAQRFPHEAAKAVKYGMTEQQALESITINGAKVLGIDKWVGSLEKGKQADVIIMSGEPLDMYSRVEMTFIDGEMVFDRANWTEPALTSPMPRLFAVTGDAEVNQ